MIDKIIEHTQSKNIFAKRRKVKIIIKIFFENICFIKNYYYFGTRIHP